jgi:hypothetical protein
MNCKPGDLARLVGFAPDLKMNDKLVKLADKEPVTIGGIAQWALAEKLRVQVPSAVRLRLSNGSVFHPGDIIHLSTLADKHLRPIRDPGDDAVDQTLVPGYVRDGVTA